MFSSCFFGRLRRWHAPLPDFLFHCYSFYVFAGAYRCSMQTGLNHAYSCVKGLKRHFLLQLYLHLRTWFCQQHSHRWWSSVSEILLSYSIENRIHCGLFWFTAPRHSIVSDSVGLSSMFINSVNGRGSGLGSRSHSLQPWPPFLLPPGSFRMGWNILDGIW